MKRRKPVPFVVPGSEPVVIERGVVVIEVRLDDLKGGRPK